MWTKGRKQALIDSIIEMSEKKGIFIAGNQALLDGFKKMNEKELDELEHLVSQLVNTVQLQGDQDHAS